MADPAGLLSPKALAILQDVARDQIPSALDHDALELIKRGWLGVFLSDATPGRVRIFTLSEAGSRAIADHQAAEAAKARAA